MNQQVLAINDKVIEVYDFEQKKVCSKHTSKEILEISFRCDFEQKDDNEWFNSILESKDIKVKLRPSAETVKHFIRGKGSYNFSSTYQNGKATYSHSVSLTETEKIVVKRIIIGDLVFVPYYYIEKEHSDTQIVIDFKCIVDERQRQKFIKILYEDKKNIEIIRDGIDKKPRIMRFGRTRWSKIDSEKKWKYNIILVDYVPNERDFPIPSKLEVNNLILMFIKNKLALTKLIDKLIDTNVIAEDDIVSDFKKDKDFGSFSEIHHNLYKVVDIDEDL